MAARLTQVIDVEDIGGSATGPTVALLVLGRLWLLDKRVDLGEGVLGVGGHCGGVMHVVRLRGWWTKTKLKLMVATLLKQ